MSFHGLNSIKIYFIEKNKILQYYMITDMGFGPAPQEIGVVPANRIAGRSTFGPFLAFHWPATRFLAMLFSIKNSKRVNVESLEGSFFVSISLLEFQTQIHANVRIAWRIRSVHDPDLNFKIKQ